MMRISGKCHLELKRCDNLPNPENVCVTTWWPSWRCMAAPQIALKKKNRCVRNVCKDG